MAGPAHQQVAGKGNHANNTEKHQKRSLSVAGPALKKMFSFCAQRHLQKNYLFVARINDNLRLPTPVAGQIKKTETSN
jgi:hypothetical protein